MKLKLDPLTQHHPWCNFFMRPREGCKMCERFYQDYPFKDGEDSIELTKRFFPNVEVIE